MAARETVSSKPEITSGRWQRVGSIVQSIMPQYKREPVFTPEEQKQRATQLRLKENSPRIRTVGGNFVNQRMSATSAQRKIAQRAADVLVYNPRTRQGIINNHTALVVCAMTADTDHPTRGNRGLLPGNSRLSRLRKATNLICEAIVERCEQEDIDLTWADPEMAESLDPEAVMIPLKAGESVPSSLAVNTALDQTYSEALLHHADQDRTGKEALSTIAVVSVIDVAPLARSFNLHDQPDSAVPGCRYDEMSCGGVAQMYDVPIDNPGATLWVPEHVRAPRPLVS